MVYVLVGVLFLVVLVFGASAVMGSYAQARQAEAVIEVARLGQINAVGNLLVIALVVLVIVLALGLLVWASSARFANSANRSAQLRGLSNQPSAVDVNMLVQLETLRALRAMQQLPAPRADVMNEPEDAQMLYWLRQ